MNLKQMIGLIVLALGVIVVIYGAQSQKQLNEGASSYRGLTHLIPNQFLQSKANQKIDHTVNEYQQQINLCYAVGVILMVGGIGVAVYYRDRR